MSDEYNVLIVDDQEETRKNVARLLQFENDINVVGTARTGQDAIKQTIALDPDVVLMDINMPDMDGIETTRRILTYRNKDAVANEPVILGVTASVDPSTLRRCRDAGMVEVKTRGKAVDPDRVQSDLRGDGDTTYTVFILRFDRQVRALVTRRVAKG